MKHTLVTSVARIVVIEDNASDVFLLDRALNQQDLRFELIHLLSGAEALAFIRRQGAYADAAIPNLRSEERRVGKECRSRWSPYH